MDIVLKEEDYGKEYLAQLKKVLEIRKDRRLIYSDSFKDESFENLQAIIDGKLGRAKKIMDIHGTSHPKYQDEIIDVINYLLFLLHNVSKETKALE